MSAVKELVDRVLTEGFQMPLLVNMDKKSNRLSALQEARESAFAEYDSLKSEEYILK